MKKNISEKITEKIRTNFNKISKKKLSLKKNVKFNNIFDSLDLFNLTTVIEEEMKPYNLNFNLEPIEIIQKYQNLEKLERYIKKCLKK